MHYHLPLRVDMSARAYLDIRFSQVALLSFIEKIEVVNKSNNIIMETSDIKESVSYT